MVNTGASTHMLQCSQHTGSSTHMLQCGQRWCQHAHAAVWSALVPARTCCSVVTGQHRYQHAHAALRAALVPAHAAVWSALVPARTCCSVISTSASTCFSAPLACRFQIVVGALQHNGHRLHAEGKNHLKNNGDDVLEIKFLLKFKTEMWKYTIFRRKKFN